MKKDNYFNLDILIKEMDDTKFLIRNLVKSSLELEDFSFNTIDRFGDGLYYVSLAQEFIKQINSIVIGENDEEAFHRNLDEGIEKIVSSYCEQE